MNEIRRWFLWTVIIGPIHLCEQLATGLDEPQELKGFTAQYYSWFSNADDVTVLLVMIPFTLVNVIVYALLVRGRARLIALGLFAMVALGELHHIVKSVVHAAYFPGAVTAIPFFIFGVLLLRAIIREWRVTESAGKLAAAALPRHLSRDKQHERHTTLVRLAHPCPRNSRRRTAPVWH